MALPSTALVRTNVEKSESQSAQSPPLDLLRTTSLPVMRRGPGLTISQLAKAGGTLIESGLNMVLNHRGPAHYETSIKRFFGDDDHDKREAALDELHIALVSGECRSARHKDLRDDCCQLLKYARPKSYSIDTQLVTFKILVAIITRYPGLRQHFYDHKDLRNNENQSGIDFENLWRRQLQSCGEEWNFYRDLAAFCISENDLAKLVEADKPSEVAVVKLEDGNLNKVPIEILLGWCRSGPEFDPPRVCAIHHLGGILALPSFWQKGIPDEERFLVVLSDVCGTIFQLLCDTEAKSTDTSVDTSPSMSAARNALDILCTVMFSGLLRLRDTDCVPRDCPVRVPDIITLLMSGEDIKTCFPSASAMAPSIRDLLAQSLGNPSTTNPSTKNEGEISKTVDEVKPVGLFSVAMTSTKSPPVIQADIRRALDRMQVQYRENKGRFECIHLPSIDISYVDRPSTPQRHHHQQASSGSGDTPAAPTPRPSLVNKVSKLSFGIRGRDRSRDRDLSVDKEREASGGPSGVTLTRISSSSSSSFFNVTSHQPIAAPEPKLAPVVNGVAPTNLAGDVDRPPSRTASPVSVKVLPPIPRDFAASPMQMSPGMVDRDVFESMGNNMLSVRFEINIVKVPWLPFHGIQFRRAKGDGWQYKMLTRRVLTELKL